MYEKTTRMYEKSDIQLAEVLRLIDPFDFAPAVRFAQRIDITNA